MTDQTPIEARRPAGPGAEHTTEQTAGPRLYGVVDVIRPNRVAGWVIDRTDPGAHAEVEVRREGRIIATIAANRPRKDLARGGVGTGNYGFSVALEPVLEPGMEFTISVTARSQDGDEAALQTVVKAGQGAREETLLKRIFGEMLDLRAEIAARRTEEAARAARTAETVERMEVVQARLEAALAAVAAPPQPAQGALWSLVATALLLGGGSLAIGIVSLWWR